ncbi:23805_t:CDS:2 [Dentiscutata erythropus]|uniref:23805_t:CDS:1 n=1 Tax=Dentiscutata erythropus TaxID=1348616 RepID=A0A9N9H8X9_9GLOM|nr:23805_t:CDS:2 [Dentiscutata erythropus]
MPLLSKEKRKAKNQARDIKGHDTEDELDVSIKNGGEENGGWNKYNELNVSDLEWGDEDDSGWDDMEIRPTGIFTKAAVGTKKITSFFTSSQPLDPNNLEEISDDSNSEPDSYTLMINRKANDLKKQLKQNHNKLIVKEYNYKKAIFEYLILLSKNNRREKIKASLDVARKVFIDGNV